MGQTLGARLEDRYYLQKVKLGEGSFGTVWRAVDRSTNQAVAVKQLDKASMPRRGISSADIEREVTIMKAVLHENIIRLLDTFQDYNSIYLALEYCDGGDFGDKVKERGLTLEEHKAAEWMQQILSAIAALHAQDVCHRDIKPDNFMVHGDQLKLSDFGLALFVQRGRLLTEKCGTPAFMAPEQHKLPRFSRGYTHLVDVWAAGLIMYMLLSGGRHPFVTESSQRLDEKRLLQGTLDFNATQTFFSFGSASSRYSEPARRLCKRLVEPDMRKRPAAEAALTDLWLRCRNTEGGDLAAPKAPMAKPALDSLACSASLLAGQEQRSGSVDVQSALHKRIEMLEEQLRVQQEHAESQFEVMQVFQQLVQEKQKLEESQKGVATEAEKFQGKPRRAVMQAGTKCRYSPSWLSWVPAVIQGFNPEDGTYDLNILAHAKLEHISPASDVTAAEAWPPGSLVHYESSSLRHWLPATICSFNEGAGGGQGTYNLDVRDSAQVDRMRPRLSS